MMKMRRITFRATVEDREYQNGNGPILPDTPYTATESECYVTLLVDALGRIEKIEDITPTPEQTRADIEKGWNS
jgi:hypothetical protein